MPFCLQCISPIVQSVLHFAYSAFRLRAYRTVGFALRLQYGTNA